MMWCLSKGCTWKINWICYTRLHKTLLHNTAAPLYPDPPPTPNIENHCSFGNGCKGPVCRPVDPQFVQYDSNHGNAHSAIRCLSRDPPCLVPLCSLPPIPWPVWSTWPIARPSPLGLLATRLWPWTLVRSHLSNFVRAVVRISSIVVIWPRPNDICREGVSPPHPLDRVVHLWFSIDFHNTALFCFPSFLPLWATSMNLIPAQHHRNPRRARYIWHCQRHVCVRCVCRHLGGVGGAVWGRRRGRRREKNGVANAPAIAHCCCQCFFSNPTIDCVNFVLFQQSSCRIQFVLLWTVAILLVLGFVPLYIQSNKEQQQWSVRKKNHRAEKEPPTPQTHNKHITPLTNHVWQCGRVFFLIRCHGLPQHIVLIGQQSAFLFQSNVVRRGLLQFISEFDGRRMWQWFD